MVPRIQLYFHHSIHKKSLFCDGFAKEGENKCFTVSLKLLLVFVCPHGILTTHTNICSFKNVTLKVEYFYNVLLTANISWIYLNDIHLIAKILASLMVRSIFIYNNNNNNNNNNKKTTTATTAKNNFGSSLSYKICIECFRMLVL